MIPAIKGHRNIDNMNVEHDGSDDKRSNKRSDENVHQKSVNVHQKSDERTIKMMEQQQHQIQQLQHQLKENEEYESERG